MTDLMFPPGTPVEIMVRYQSGFDVHNCKPILVTLFSPAYAAGDHQSAEFAEHWIRSEVVRRGVELADLIVIAVVRAPPEEV